MNRGESLVIVPNKKNDLNKDGFYTTTLIEWDYLYESNIGDRVIEVEWSSNKKEQFISAGNYTVKLRVKTETGGWSNWSEINIPIKESIVFSQLYTAKDFTSFDNLYALSKSTPTSSQQTVLNGAKSKDSTSKFIIPIANSNNCHTVIGHTLNDNSNYYEYGQYNTKKEWSNEMSRTLSDYSGALTLMDQKSYSQNSGYSTAGTSTRSALQGYGVVSNSETRRSIVYYYNRTFLGWGSPQYKWKAKEYYRISTTVANKKISDTIALNNAYPTNSQHTDGYWYMRGNNIPNYKIYQLDNSYKQQSSFEPLTNTLSSNSIKLSSVLDKVKVKTDISKPSGTNFVFEISTNKTSWKTVSASSLNGVTDITLPAQSNTIYWRIKLQSNGTQIPAVNSVVISQ